MLFNPAFCAELRRPAAVDINSNLPSIGNCCNLIKLGCEILRTVSL